jgi:hypothetical protein
MTTLQRSPKRYSDEEIDRGLVALALHAGNRRAASEALAREGVEIPQDTLRHWLERKRDRYDELRTELLPRIRERIAQQSEDLAQAYAEKELELLAGLKDEPMKPSDRASVIRNLSTSRGISVDKAMAMRGMPTQIVEHRTADHTWAKLKEMGLVVDSTAEELDPPASPASDPDTPQQPAQVPTSKPSS